MAKTKKTKKEAKPKPVVLEIRNVYFASGTTNAVGLREANLTVREGDLVMLRMTRSQKCRDVVSMLQGLHHPSEGEVLFQNADWKGEDFDRHFQMRSRIGRVFEDQGWIQNFNILDNVTLASRHHRPSDSKIRQQVSSWAERFNVSAAPFSRPSFVDPAALQVYQWIRALIGKPALLILERPMNSVSITRLPKLIEVINEVRKQGAAVLWFTSNARDLSDDLDSPRVDYRLIDGELQRVKGETNDE